MNDLFTNGQTSSYALDMTEQAAARARRDRKREQRRALGPVLAPLVTLADRISVYADDARYMRSRPDHLAADIDDAARELRAIIDAAMAERDAARYPVVSDD